MFERYTEHARRVIFFARYEASQYGSPFIETEHILLGILREDKTLMARFVPPEATDPIRQQIEAKKPIKKRISVSTDLPLSEDCRQVLRYGAEEADRLNRKHIGTEHLLLGLPCVKNGLAAEILQGFKVELASAREGVALLPGEWVSKTYDLSHTRQALENARQRREEKADATIEIHSQKRSLSAIRAAVSRCKQVTWFWEKKNWLPRDLVVDRPSGRFLVRPQTC